MRACMVGDCTWLEQNHTYWGEDQMCIGSSNLEIPGDFTMMKVWWMLIWQSHAIARLSAFWKCYCWPISKAV